MSAESVKSATEFTSKDQLEILNAYVAIVHKADKVSINAGDYVCQKLIPFCNAECNAIGAYFAEGPAYVLECLESKRPRYLGVTADTLLAISCIDEIFVVRCDSRLLHPVSRKEKISPLLTEFVKDTPLQAPAPGIAVRPRRGYHFVDDNKNASPSVAGKKFVVPAMVALPSVGNGLCKMAGITSDGNLRTFSLNDVLVCEYKQDDVQM